MERVRFPTQHDTLQETGLIPVGEAPGTGETVFAGSEENRFILEATTRQEEDG
jgi:hypothetical protein